MSDVATKTLLSYVDVESVRARWDAAVADLRARLPEKDANGKLVKKDDHVPPDETLYKFVSNAVTSVVLSEIEADLKAELFASIKKGKA